MPIVNCPNCKQPVNTSMGNCFNCGAEVMPSGVLKSPGASSEISNVLMAGFIVIGVLFIAGAVFLIRTSSQSSDASNGCSNRIAAFVMSQEFVLRQLRSPSTADFPNITATGVSSTATNNCHFEISAFVDSQNGFGATVRSNYTATIAYLPGAETWELVALAIE